MIEIKVPPVGESISEVTLVQWIKKDGEWVERDEVICELESEKATFELNAEQAGILHTVAQEGDNLNIGDIACKIDESAERPATAAAPEKKAEEPVAEKATSATPAAEASATSTSPTAEAADVKATPVAKSIMADKKVAPNSVKGSGSRSEERRVGKGE